MPEHPDPKIRPHPWAEFYREPMLRSMHPFTRDGEEKSGIRRKEAAHRYAELAVTSNYTFLTGASHPEELIEQAAALGYEAIALTDRNTVAGIVRAHVAAKDAGMQFIVGSRIALTVSESCAHTCDANGDVSPAYSPSLSGRGSGGGSSAHSKEMCVWTNHVPPTPQPPPSREGERNHELSVLVYPTDLASYGRLCRLLTLGKRRAPKGECHLTLHDLLDHSDGLLAVVMLPDAALPGEQFWLDVLAGLRRTFDGDRLSLAVSRLYGERDRERCEQLAALSEHTHIPLVAINDVHYHVPGRRPLQDVLTCIRHGCTIEQAGLRLFPNGERYLKPPEELARLFAEHPQAIERTVVIAERTRGFNLDQLRYQYPDEVCPPGVSPIEHLTNLSWQGAAQRYPQGVPADVKQRIDHELRLIDELNYAPYFLTVHDLVVYARSIGILCQGRGAAANSAVCYVLGVTAVDPDHIDLLFERFISKERNEPPDIDIDFEHERREEVIQYIYRKYGRDRAALTAEVITYRGRSAVRDVGKAMGLSLDCVDRLAKDIDWWSDRVNQNARLRAMGLDPTEPTLRMVMELSEEILGFPRHLSQHVGGFVMTRGPLCEMVPIENAAMPDRTVIEWDKDDIDAVGMLKVDCLGLGMLTAIGWAFRMLNEREQERRRDGETKRRNGGEWEQHQEKYHGECEDVSRLDCLAEGDGVGDGGVRDDQRHAEIGAIWIDGADVPSGGLHSIEYCRGVRSRVSSGFAEVSTNRTRIASRDCDAIRTGKSAENDYTCAGGQQCDPGNRPSVAGSDPQPAAPEQKVDCSRATASSLRLSVSPSLSGPLELHTVPPEDPLVYDAICRADTIGVFQIESRAQMTMLPRLRPRKFYDLVIEVAIVRPGPIQGDMVHPYLRRRNGEEAVAYPNEDIRRVLGKTLGVPLFQEQAMSLAIVAAGFTPGEADQLRRAMAAWKRNGDKLLRFENRFISGMLERGYEREFAERCFSQLRGFSEYGFPESHAASFALLVYVSAWLKVHHPAVFAAALLNSQPMGFYAPAQIVRDAQEHGVEVRGVDVNFSEWNCTLEEGDEETERRRDGVKNHESESTSSRRLSVSPSCSAPSLRLGFRQIRGFKQTDADAIASAVKNHGPCSSIEALQRASGMRVSALRKLARADAFGSMGLDRQSALWHVRALRDETLPMFENVEASAQRIVQPQPKLPAVPLPRRVIQDYDAIGLSLKAHPLSFLRDSLTKRSVTPTGELADEAKWPHNTPANVAGLVLVRQRPATASGLIFMTIEDETGIANLIVRPHVYERFRQAAKHGVAVLAKGIVERQGAVVHVVVKRIDSLDEEISDLLVRSRDFH